MLDRSRQTRGLGSGPAAITPRVTRRAKLSVHGEEAALQIREGPVELG